MSRRLSLKRSCFRRNDTRVLDMDRVGGLVEPSLAASSGERRRLLSTWILPTWTTAAHREPPVRERRRRRRRVPHERILFRSVAVVCSSRILGRRSMGHRRTGRAIATGLALIAVAGCRARIASLDVTPRRLAIYGTGAVEGAATRPRARQDERAAARDARDHLDVLRSEGCRGIAATDTSSRGRRERRSSWCNRARSPASATVEVVDLPGSSWLPPCSGWSGLPAPLRSSSSRARTPGTSRPRFPPVSWL